VRQRLEKKQLLNESLTYLSDMNKKIHHLKTIN